MASIVLLSAVSSARAAEALVECGRHPTYAGAASWFLTLEKDGSASLFTEHWNGTGVGRRLVKKTGWSKGLGFSGMDIYMNLYDGFLLEMKRREGTGGPVAYDALLTARVEGLGEHGGPLDVYVQMTCEER